MSFENALQEKVNSIEQIITKYLPKEEGFQKTVLSAMNYSVLGGGKRLRPLLMSETYRMFGGSDLEIEPFEAAIEMLHTYSLVHDDLPAMDNDEYRRGRKTTHVIYGEAMAILAGDALLNFAFETAMRAFEMSNNPTVTAKALLVFGKKAGIYGMIGGQVADVEAEKTPSLEMTKERLLFIHEHKTAALIQSAMMVGAILAGASDEDVAKIEKAGYSIGVAFQIQDDILDVIGSMDELGKPIGSDARNDKKTYVTFKGLEQAQIDQRELSKEAIEILSSFSNRNSFLEELVDSLVNRQK